MKWLALACAACVVLLLGTVWLRLCADDLAVPAGPAAAGPAAARAAGGRAAALAAARRSCDPEQLDRFVAEQRAQVARSPHDALARRLCAEALLERVLLRNQLRGMVVGEPVHAELPAETAADIDEALALLAAARSAGDDSSDNWRLEAALLGNRITGLASALQWNGRIEAALEEAAARDAHNPALHVALGLRRLLAPRWLGHDPEQALRHLEFAAGAMPDDERPDVFAAMAAYLLRKRQQAIAKLEQAVARNPNNRFAHVVLQRLRRGEPEPFERDVAAAEASAQPGGEPR